MPLTKLDTNCALVVIDLQKGIVGLPAVGSIGDILSRTARLARAFREQGLPVVLVNVTGGAPGRTDAGSPKFSFPADWTELVPELEQQPEDHAVSKQRWGAFIGTSLDSYCAEPQRNLCRLDGSRDKYRRRVDGTQRLRSRLPCSACCGCDDGPGCRCAPP